MSDYGLVEPPVEPTVLPSASKQTVASRLDIGEAYTLMQGNKFSSARLATATRRPFAASLFKHTWEMQQKKLKNRKPKDKDLTKAAVPLMETTAEDVRMTGNLQGSRSMENKESD